MEFTHIDRNGNAVMVDVGGKEITEREAVASGRIKMSRECYEAVKNRTAKKGDVLTVAQVAGIMGTKKTPELIPLCHLLNLTKAGVEWVMHPDSLEIEAVCTVRTAGRTGVEMEALTGVSVALLTVYDMCKAIDKGMEIAGICLEKKSGGKSGAYLRCGEKGADGQEESEV